MWSVVLAGMVCLCCVGPGHSDTVPITTDAEEARDAYLQSRDLFEKLKPFEANELARQAVELDEDFALAHLMVAITTSSSTERFESLERAVELSDSVDPGERHMILGFEARIKGDTNAQEEHYQQLILAYPNDARAHNLLGAYYFERQEWRMAIEHYRRANELDPEFSPPYNQLGYALRFLGQLEEAEAAFGEYVRLIPDEPNPYDSYGELLMKLGRFDESIESYETALERDLSFVPSYVGIGNNLIFKGRPAAARETFDRLTEVARTDSARREARFWTVVSYLHEARYDEALKAVESLSAIAREDGDVATLSRDMVLMGDILLEAGDPDGAVEKYHDAMELSERSDAPEEVKRAARRNILYNEARVALERRDLEAARTIVNRYGDLVGQYQIPSERRRHRELVGLIALAEKDFATAVSHLEKADLRDPRVLYELALAYYGAGDRDKARETAQEAENWNALGINFAYVKRRAAELLGWI